MPPLPAFVVLRDVAPRLKIEFAIVRPAGIYGHGDHGPVDRLVKHIVASKLGVDAPLFHVPMWIARAVASGLGNQEKLDALTEAIAFDTSKAKRLIGFLPRVTYEEGIERILAER